MPKPIVPVVLVIAAATAVKATAATLVKIPMEKVTPIAAGLTKTMPVPKVLVVLATASDEPGQDGSSAKVLAMTTVTYLITAWYQRQRP